MIDFCFPDILSSLCTISSFKFVPLNREIIYEYAGEVRVGAQAPMDNDNSKAPPSSGWKIRGTLKLQRRTNDTLAAAVCITHLFLRRLPQIKICANMLFCVCVCFLFI